MYYNLNSIYFSSFRGSPHYTDFEKIENSPLGTVIMTQREDPSLMGKNTKNCVNGNKVLWGLQNWYVNI